MFKTASYICTATGTITQKISSSKLYYPLLCLGLSWLYALCSQIIIPLPFNFVPLSIQPLPVTLLALLLGKPAVIAYVLYLLQGIAGAPFFAGMGSGLVHFVGPTGGYLIGFLCAALFLLAVRHLKQASKLATFIKLELANIIVFACGLAYLSFFVSPQKLLLTGLFPFFIGDFIIKAVVQVFLVGLFQASRTTQHADKP